MRVYTAADGSTLRAAAECLRTRQRVQATRRDRDGCAPAGGPGGVSALRGGVFTGGRIDTRRGTSLLPRHRADAGPGCRRARGGVRPSIRFGIEYEPAAVVRRCRSRRVRFVPRFRRDGRRARWRHVRRWPAEFSPLQVSASNLDVSPVRTTRVCREGDDGSRTCVGALRRRAGNRCSGKRCGCAIG